MKSDDTYIRTFIAISLPKEVKADLQTLQWQLQKTGIKATWPRPASMHLTLKFIGNVETNKIFNIKRCMEKAIKGMIGFTLSAEGIGGFPSVRNARVIWAGTSGQTDVLKKLSTRLEDALLKNLQIKKEQRYSSHLTVARIKKPVFPKRMSAIFERFKTFHSKDFFVSEITLFQSELTSSGAVHKKLLSIPFNNNVTMK